MGRVIPELAQRIADIASDRHSGASQLSAEARRVLTASFAHGCTVEVAAALCRAQPAMAPIWNAAIAAVSARDAPPRWEKASLRWERGLRALEHIALDALRGADQDLHIVTCSQSASVVTVVRRLAEHHRVRVSCSEGRPALEGRQLAVVLRDAGIAVDFYTDAALGTTVDEADMLLVGADAVSGDAWMNKVGTRFLAAAAHHRGLPVHVLATVDKLVMPALWPHLTQRPAAAEEVWPAAPDGIHVRNPYFEAIPIDLATTVVTDLGVLGIDMVPDACRALATPSAARALDELLAAFDERQANPPS